MKTTQVFVTGALAIGVLAGGASRAFAQTMPLRSGTWKLNVAKSTYDPGPAPRSSLRIDDAAKDGLKSTVEGVDAKGNKVSYRFDCKYDGKDYPIVGAGTPSGADTIAYTHIDAMTSDVAFKKGGKVVQTAKTSITSDGKMLTVTSNGTTAAGKPTHNVTIWEKQ